MSDDVSVSFLDNEKKITNNKDKPKEFGFFDRVINLRLTTSDGQGNAKDVFVLRSDYELVYPDLMNTIAKGDTSAYLALSKCYIRKCQHKPSIKVQYKRVSLNTATEVDIFINNFYMLDRNGQVISGFNNSDFRLSKVELAMGYFQQFEKACMGRTPQSIDDFNKVGFEKEDAESFGITTLTMSNVVYTQMDKLPPDMTLHIHGFVGNYFAPKFSTDTDDFPDEYEKLTESKAVLSSENFSHGDTYLDSVYFEQVTRIWLKEGSLTKEQAEDIRSNMKGKLKEEGIMSDSDAEKYGIKVYLSKGVADYSKGLESKYKKKDAQGNAVYSSIKIEPASTAEEKMNKIASAYKLEGFTQVPLSSGDYIVCLQKELNDISALLEGMEVVKDFFDKTPVKKYFLNQIPAVYNITADALCTIVCPFFCFVNPFEKLKFKTRYALGGMVSYYTNFNSTLNEFYALWENVSFATVEDINECMIACTGQKKGD